MSPRSRTPRVAARLSSGALLLALALPTPASAQAPGAGEPFTSVMDSSAYLGQTPLRVWHRTRGFGEETAETALGTHWATPLETGLAFIDGQFRVGNSDNDFSVNFGGGFRWRQDEFITNTPRIFGVNFWYDGEDTQLDNWFNQLGVGFERLGDMVDLRLNANFPLEDVKESKDVVATNDLMFVGNSISQGTLVTSDVSLRVVDFEIAPRIFNLNAWVYGGGYQMDGEGVSEFGEKGGVRGYVTNDLLLDVGVSDDEVFGTNTVVQIVWTPGRTTANASSWSHNIEDRMREQVYRNAYVAVDQVQTTGAAALIDAAGQDIRVVHVDSSAAPGGDGSFENPLNSLSTVQANSQVGDIILVHAGSSFTGQTATLQDAQRFLGEGDLDGNGVREAHFIVSQQFGQIELPATSANADTLASPIIQAAAGADAVVLAGGNDKVETLAEIEVSNFQITGGARGIASPTGVADVNISRVEFTNLTGNAIELKPLVETLTNNSKRVRFTPTIDDVTFTGIGGDDIHIDATTSQPASTPVTESIVISNVTSDDGAGVGVNLINTKRAVAISNFDWDGGTTGEGALRIEDAGAQSNVTLSGTNTMTGGSVGVANEGYAIALVDSAAVHTVTGTTITDMGGDSILVDGGAADLNFTGSITQSANDASVVQVGGNHTGDLTFAELTSGAGVIDATTGDGLQFDNADGTYTFVDLVNLNGGDAAIDILNSDGAITLSDANITNPSGIAVNVVGGDANLTFTGEITKTLVAASTVSVTGGHTGTLIFNERTANSGVIEATIGDGLQFDNADGTYTFNDEVVLNGGVNGTGIDVINNSEGTFTFVDVDVDYGAATGSAVRIDGSEPQTFTISGDITATDGTAVEITNNAGGSMIFNTAITATNAAGIVSQNNTGGAVSFTGAVALNTGADAGVFINNNSSGSTSFSNLDITTTTGAAYTATNSASHSVSVTGSGNTISTAQGVALNLNTVTVGGSGINFASVDVTSGATSAIVLNNVTGGSVNIGSGAANPGGGGTLNTADEAVLITNAANVSLNRLNITGTGAGDSGIEVNHTGGVVSNVTITNTQIQNSGAFGIDYNRSATATSRLTLNGNDVSNTGDQAIAIDISGSSDANITISNGNNIDAGAFEALALTTSGGSSKTVRLLVDGNSFTNNDGTDPTADFQIGGAGTLNATITDNTFVNADGATGRGLEMNSISPTAIVRLNLDNNTASSANAGGDYLLQETSGDFNVQDLATVDARNVGDVQQVGTLDDDAGPIPLPQ